MAVVPRQKTPQNPTTSKKNRKQASNDTEAWVGFSILVLLGLIMAGIFVYLAWAYLTHEPLVMNYH